MNGNEDYSARFDPYLLHHPFFKPLEDVFIYSSWYFLLFSPLNATKVKILHPSFSSILTALGQKLKSSPQAFHVNKIEYFDTGGFSANLSLANKALPHLPTNLLQLKTTNPILKFKPSFTKIDLI